MSLAAVLKWVDLSRVILGPILAAKGVDPKIIGGVVNSVGDAEVALGPGTGQQKLAAVIDGLQQTMSASGASSETIAATTAAVTDGISTGIATIKDVQAVKAAHDAGQVATAPVPTGAVSAPVVPTTPPASTT